MAYINVETTGGGGYEMIEWVDDGSNSDLTEVASLLDGSDDKVINAFTAQRWSNCDVTSLTINAPQGTDTMGLWEDSPTWKNYSPATDDPHTYRSGWLYHKALYGILSDDSIEVTPIFDIEKGEVVSLYAMRIDDEIYLAVSSPDPADNPKKEGWFEKSGTTFSLSTDTAVVSGKTYYVGVGAVAFKFNGVIYSPGGVKVGLSLKEQRINELSLNTM